MSPSGATSKHKLTTIPLGNASDYRREYSPHLLFAVARADARSKLVPGGCPSFHGEDLWTAWELSWLDANGRPLIATATLRIPADSPQIIESKSLKLYLNSLAFTRYASIAELRGVIALDLSACAQADVDVQLCSAVDAKESFTATLPGLCIDDADASFDVPAADARMLRSDTGIMVSEELHSHLLRSNCPITRQPDTGSILIRYRGPKIHHGSLLEYLVSYREHDAFHEACVERIFVDLKTRCRPDRLTVYARYNRRGGIDINPFRSDFEDAAPNIRLWRQ
jgi:7-cyano-7-deazaguanine reductase